MAAYFDLLNGYLMLSKKSYGNDNFNGSWNFGPNENNITVYEVISKLIKILGVNKKFLLKKIKKLKSQDC